MEPHTSESENKTVMFLGAVSITSITSKLCCTRELLDTMYVLSPLASKGFHPQIRQTPQIPLNTSQSPEATGMSIPLSLFSTRGPGLAILCEGQRLPSRQEPFPLPLLCFSLPSSPLSFNLTHF